MKKKALSLTALACALCLSVGLAACGEKSDEMTAEKWADLFGNASSYTVTTALSMPDGSTSGMTVKVDGDKRQTAVHFPDGDGELYYSKENGEYFEYIVKASLGVKQKLPMGTTQPMTTAQFDAMGGYLAVFKDDFASFTLADGKYTCASLDKTSTAGAVFTNVAVTFEKGALARVEYEAGAKVVISDIGKTGITLPQISTGSEGGEGGNGGSGGEGGEGGSGSSGGASNLTENTDFSALVSEQVTETAWQAAFGDDAFANSTIEYAYSETEGNGTVYRKCKTDGANKYVSVTPQGYSSYYYSVESTKMYMYVPDEGDYARSEIGAEAEERAYLLYTLVCLDLSENFADFTYNATAGAYEYKGAGISANSPMEPGWTMTFTNISVKIVGGKLAYIACDRVDGGSTDEHYAFKCYDYGTTNVTLPTNFTDAV